MYIEHSNFRAPASPVVPASLFIAAYSLTVLRLLRHLMNYSMQEIFVQLCGRYGGFYIKHTYSVTLCNNIYEQYLINIIKLLIWDLPKPDSLDTLLNLTVLQSPTLQNPSTVENRICNRITRHDGTLG